MSLRLVSINELRLDTSRQSQWLKADMYRSCFCAGQGSATADWTIEAQLSDGSVIQVGSYLKNTNDPGNPYSTLFNATTPRYIGINAMCGLPIRFVASADQPSAKLWVIFKS